MTTLKRCAASRWLLTFLVAVVSATLPACILDVEYAHRGQSLVPHEGKALVFTRIRFFHDGREYFPWGAPTLGDVLLERDPDEARHLWLRRLDETAVSWELWPEKDGLLMIWLPPGDYALVGSEDDLGEYPAPTLAVVALLRVAADRPVLYAGELTFADEFREGWHRHYIFGSAGVQTESVAELTSMVEARYGALPGPPAVAAWCVGRELPSGNNNPGFVSQSRRLLDADCPASP
jgi:hypothetical protein